MHPVSPMDALNYLYIVPQETIEKLTLYLFQMVFFLTMNLHEEELIL